MRKNLPVTEREHVLPKDAQLVSVTDLTGHITYCNQDFLDASGFERDELLGKPHNIIRHPDVPQEAFRDLWHTVKAGRPWGGIVKNRRKNGDHYWVHSHIIPMRDKEQINGYLSVRIPANRESIQLAEGLYARLNQEAQLERPSIRLHHGKVVRSGPLPAWFERIRPGTRSQIGMTLLVLAGISVLLGHSALALAASLPAGLVASLLATRLIGAMTVSPLHELVDDAYQIASGNLSPIAVSGRPGPITDLRTAIAQIAFNLRSVINDIRTGTHMLHTAVDEIANGNIELSERTESQAKNLQQTATSMEQINHTMSENAKSTLHSAELAQHMQDITRQSDAAVRAVVETMQGITDSSRRISEIIQVIEGVAFQTNILALNAAVEAARAGEAGRGFAVVAAEVRSLAQRTGNAAREIRGLITESCQRVDVGNQRSEEARSRMRDVQTAVDNVSALLNDINNASNEQRLGVERVTAAIAQLDDITRQNATMVEQLAASAHSLALHSTEVRNSTRVFQLSHTEATVASINARQLREAAQQRQLRDLRPD